MTVDRGERTVQAAQAKLFAADIVDVTSDAVQVFGGYGYSEEYPVARRMRAAKIYQMYEGRVRCNASSSHVFESALPYVMELHVDVLALCRIVGLPWIAPVRCARFPSSKRRLGR